MTFQRIVITGIRGSAGSYITEYILANHPEVEIHGYARWHANQRPMDPRVTMHEVDLLDISSIQRALRMSWPSAIFHIASHANVRHGFDTPLAVLENNIMGTANLLEAIRLGYGSMALNKPTFVMCSTSEVYGQPDPKHVPVDEGCPTNPLSPYGVSKLAQDALSYSYFLAHKIPTIRTRMFSYFNARRDDLFTTSFARQIVAIERGEKKELIHGNLDSVRTLIDVRDACEAYWKSLFCTPGDVYNIGGENTHTVGEYLDILKSYAKCHIPSRQDPSLIRPADVTLQIPNSNKFKKETGWKPKYTLEQSIEHLMMECRK